MSREYTPDEMFQQLKQFFIEKRGFKERDIIKYPKELGPVRVPLYCVKKDNKKKIVDEIIIDIVTSNTIVKEQFFPTIPGGDFDILEAAPVIFYQYYFPKAKVFIAYPNILKNDLEFKEVKNICLKRGIGLLEVSKNSVNEEVASKTLVTVFDEDIKNRKDRNKTVREIIEDYLENYIIRLVYYPDPLYKRRAIIGRMPEMISYVLIDKLLELKKLEYSNKLKKLANEYRNESRDDYDIALKYIGDLWKERLGIEYPEIQKHLEEILLRDEKYIEHFVHQFQVFLIGAFILDKMYNAKDFVGIIESFKVKYKCKIEDAWLAASTYHDFNYGLQKFDIWLQQFFTDTLSINNEEAKDKLNILNLDAAMVRESFSDIIINLVELLNLDQDKKNIAMKFFYEKSVMDRNHGLLSALSILKLVKIHGSKPEISEGILQAAFAIACHDEDIWEALCGCKGYLKSLNACIEKNCGRKKVHSKAVEVYKQKRKNCTIWEQELMTKPIIGQISFNKWPLLFLLIFCDSVQDEGRIINTYFSNAPIIKDEKKIKIKSPLIKKWVNSGNKLKNFDKANEIKTAFSKLSYELSNKARIYKHKLSDEKWKIVDENLIYGIEKRIGIGFFVKGKRKECSLSDINVDSVSSKVKIDLAIDGLGIKHKELERISWALNDARFSVHLEEKDTEESQDIIINGSGGG